MTGSRPVATIAGVASAEARNAIRTGAASGFRAAVAIPAENTVIFCSSGGSGPTKSTPGTGRSMSLSPRASSSAPGPSPRLRRRCANMRRRGPGWNAWSRHRLKNYGRSRRALGLLTLEQTGQGHQRAGSGPRRVFDCFHPAGARAFAIAICGRATRAQGGAGGGDRSAAFRVAERRRATPSRAPASVRQVRSPRLAAFPTRRSRAIRAAGADLHRAWAAAAELAGAARPAPRPGPTGQRLPRHG